MNLFIIIFITKEYYSIYSIILSMLTNHSYQYQSNFTKKYSPPHSIDDTAFQHKNPLYRTKNTLKKTNKDF